MRDHHAMFEASALSQPHVRRELKIYLSELLAVDPLPMWCAEYESGLASGIDQVFHFFFDDNDFGEAAIGVTLTCEAEVQLIGALKEALDAVLDAVGDKGDHDFVRHPLWSRVRQLATIANIEMA